MQEKEVVTTLTLQKMMGYQVDSDLGEITPELKRDQSEKVAKDTKGQVTQGQILKKLEPEMKDTCQEIVRGKPLILDTELKIHSTAIGRKGGTIPQIQGQPSPMIPTTLTNRDQSDGIYRESKVGGDRFSPPPDLLRTIKRKEDSQFEEEKIGGPRNCRRAMYLEEQTSIPDVGKFAILGGVALLVGGLIFLSNNTD